jgi:hypothetical protein
MLVARHCLGTHRLDFLPQETCQLVTGVAVSQHRGGPFLMGGVNHVFCDGYHIAPAPNLAIEFEGELHRGEKCSSLLRC